MMRPLENGKSFSDFYARKVWQTQLGSVYSAREVLLNGKAKYI
jgi:hypothetical protein